MFVLLVEAQGDNASVGGMQSLASFTRLVAKPAVGLRLSVDAPNPATGTGSALYLDGQVRRAHGPGRAPNKAKKGPLRLHTNAHTHMSPNCRFVSFRVTCSGWHRMLLFCVWRWLMPTGKW